MRDCGLVVIGLVNIGGQPRRIQSMLWAVTSAIGECEFSEE